jgi:putative ABC transport system substrate-binding protein
LAQTLLGEVNSHLGWITAVEISRMNIKSWAPVGAVVVLAIASLTGTAVAQEKSVAVTAIVEHPALDAVRDGVQAALKEAGYESGKNLKWQYQSAQGNTGTAAQIARKFVGDKPDAIVAIATPSAQAVVAATKTVPVVFSAVTDPVAAKLVPSWEASGTNVTGVSDLLALDKQMDLVKQVVPDAKRVGMVYNPGEANSVVVVKELQKLLPTMGMTLVEAAAPRSVDVSSAARSLVGKVDVIYTSTDNNVVSAYEALVKVGQDAKIPLVASDTDSVKRGAVAAYGINYRDLGEQTGRVVARILKGEAPGSIKPEVSTKLELFVNPAAAQKQGIELSEALIKSAAEVVK